MRRITLFIILSISLLPFVRAQHYVITVSGDTLSGSTMLWDAPIMEDARVLLDAEVIFLQDVQAFGDGLHWFAIQHEEDRPYFLRRTLACSMDLYTEVPKQQAFLYPSELPELGMRTNQEALPFTHYVRPDGQWREATYEHLKADVSGFALPDKMLKDYRNMRKAQVALAAVGVGVSSYAIATDQGFSPTFALGLVMAGGSFLFEKPKRNRLWDAALYYGMDEWAEE